MDNIDKHSYVVSSEADAYLVASHCKIFALELGISEYQSSLFSAAVSEIAINAVRYAGGAQIFVSNTENGLGIQVTAVDNGKGIVNISQALEDGFSTFNEHSLGLGLGAAQRCSDEMQFNYSNASGTSITLRQYLPVAEHDIAVKAISYPALNEVYNCDAYLIKQLDGDSYFVVLADCLDISPREREKWHHQLRVVVDGTTLFLKHPLEEAAKAALKCIDIDTSRNNNVRLTILRINRTKIEYLSTHSAPIHWLYCADPLVQRNEQRTNEYNDNIHHYFKTVINRPSSFVLLLYSNGIQVDCLKPVDLNTLKKQDAYRISKTVFNDCALEHQDATAIVIKGDCHG